MKEITPDDFNTFLISNSFGLIVFLHSGSHYTIQQKKELVPFEVNENVAIAPIEIFDPQTLKNYSIDHSPFTLCFKEQFIVYRQPGIITSSSISLLLLELSALDLSVAKYEVGELIS